MEKRREAVFEENTTVSQISEEDRMTGDRNFSEEDDSEDEWDKHVYENISQKKCGSDTDDEMETTDDLETAYRWNSEYDTFSVQNNDVMMNESWNHFDSDEDESFNLLDYNI